MSLLGARWSVLFILLVVSLLCVPAASAALTINRPFEVGATITVPSDPDRARDEAFLVSGALSFETDLRGVLVGAGDVSSSFDVGRIEVYDASDGEAFARGEPELSADGATLRPLPDASFAWSFPRSHAVGATGHTVGLIVDIESHLERVADLMPRREGGPLPHLVVDGRGGLWSFVSELGRSVYLPIDGGFSVQPDSGQERTFEGTDWIVFMERGTDARLEAIGLAMPTHADLTIRFERASDDVFTERFTSARINSFVDKALDLARIVQGLDGPPEWAEPDCFADPASCIPDLPPQQATPGPVGAAALVSPPAQLQWLLPRERSAQPPHADVAAENGHDAQASEEEAASPLGVPDGVIENAGSILNGAVVGNLTGEVLLGGNALADPALSVMRFEHMDVGGFKTGSATMAGSSPFAYAGGSAYSTTAAIQVAYFIVPVLSIILFVIAIGLFVASRFRRFEDEDARGRGARVLSLVSRWGLLVLALVLFDRELYLVFGESVLATIGFWGGAGFSWGRLGFVFLIEAMVWGYASLLFGLPVGIIGRSGLRLAGFSKRTYGFAAGGAAVAAFVFGVGLIRPLIGAVLHTVETAL